MKETFGKSFIKKRNNFIYKKGDASMVATVLLIMAAIVAGVMVTSFSQKSTQKVSDKIVEIGTSVDCNDIRLSLYVNEDNVYIKNRGTLGVDRVVLRRYSGDTVIAEDIEQFNGGEKLLPSVEFNAGGVNGANKIEAKPIFISDEGDLIGCGAVAYDV